jgi:hypothetical protein
MSTKEEITAETSAKSGDKNMAVLISAHDRKDSGTLLALTV